jgi:AraC-like DNA-binding protein
MFALKMIFLRPRMLFKMKKFIFSVNDEFFNTKSHHKKIVSCVFMFNQDIMQDVKLYIRNMVCDRCKMVVKSELENMGLHPLSVELGEVELGREITNQEKQQLSERLQQLGFSLIDDRKSRLIEHIKTLIIELVHHRNGELSVNLSDYLKSHVNHDYHYISNLFSEVEGITIEKYFIAQKIEKVKELLVYDELSLSEIADLLNYSSVAYLSSQFKKVTGFTPSYFKQIRENKRKPLDKI